MTPPVHERVSKMRGAIAGVTVCIRGLVKGCGRGNVVGDLDDVLGCL